MNTEQRLKIERRIARQCMKDLLDAGFLITVFDGEDFPLRKSNNAKDILDAMFSVDEDVLYVHKRPDVADAPMERVGWVQFIYGNDGWDVIADYTTNLESALKPTFALAEKIEKECR